MFNVDQLRLQIEALIREFPDLADDEILRADMLDAETDLKTVLSELFDLADDAKENIEKQTRRLQTLSARRARFARQVEFYRELMLRLLQSADLKKIILPEATLSQMTGLPQIVGEIDLLALPDDLVRIKREPNREAIRAALLAGRELPGLALSNSQPKLLVRDK
jgi:hypothetical protein